MICHSYNIPHQGFFLHLVTLFVWGPDANACSLWSARINLGLLYCCETLVSSALISSIAACEVSPLNFFCSLTKLVEFDMMDLMLHFTWKFSMLVLFIFDFYCYPVPHVVLYLEISMWSLSNPGAPSCGQRKHFTTAPAAAQSPDCSQFCFHSSVKCSFALHVIVWYSIVWWPGISICSVQ